MLVARPPPVSSKAQLLRCRTDAKCCPGAGEFSNSTRNWQCVELILRRRKNLLWIKVCISERHGSSARLCFLSVPWATPPFSNAWATWQDDSSTLTGERVGIEGFLSLRKSRSEKKKRYVSVCVCITKKWLRRVELTRSSAGWMRRRASLRAASLCFSYPVRGGGLVVLVAEKEGIPASQAPYNRMHSRHGAPNQLWHQVECVWMCIYLFIILETCLNENNRAVCSIHQEWGVSATFYILMAAPALFNVSITIRCVGVSKASAAGSEQSLTLLND